MGKIAIVMGSSSDEEVMKPAANTLKKFGIEYDTHILSAHRMPKKTAKFAAEAIDKGYEIIIAGAGKAAHLPGVIASHTTLPVIGVPVETSDLGGLDSLLSIVQMPSGVPVATVAINGSKNAAILAVQILALKYPDLKDKLGHYKSDLES
ncbi:MAG: 5-(carboxyamino)imidazole ribonucleotide mutase [Actinomycetia bacterium]|nr:5-(carboxyamino)imidazole ribonucleotide mutase [Actinomycetes bacterium]